MDLSKLSTTDRLIVGGGIAYLICMFLPWYGLDVDTGFDTRSFSNSGWDYFLGGVLPMLLIVVMIAHVLITTYAPDTQLPDLPVPWSQVHQVAGIAAAVLVALRLLIASDEIGDIDTGVDLDRKFGLFLALIAAGAVAFGGFKKGQEASTSGGGPSI